ncbi:MAG: hypothetical protein COB02_08505 [Candidatus Cloacimonadota bacterium]|nr:MAG: hypothetical protein COB02_08505 [Candidatus Cloacimonadota bacterium]
MNERRKSEKFFFKNKEYLLSPGFLIFPLKAKTIYSVVTNGIVFTLFDLKKRQGGMGYFKYSRRIEDNTSCLFAYPNISTLVTFFIKSGSRREDIVVNFYGGAVQKKSSFSQRKLSIDNIEIAKNIFKYLDLKVAICEIGGETGRKIAFDSGSGNHVMALVEDLRESDW